MAQIEKYDADPTFHLGETCPPRFLSAGRDRGGAIRVFHFCKLKKLWRAGEGKYTNSLCLTPLRLLKYVATPLAIRNAYSGMRLTDEQFVKKRVNFFN